MQPKLLFAGPVGAGKTTAIGAVSDIPVVSTEERATDVIAAIKERTTVAMDYGVLHLDGRTDIHLYGAPGQPRFRFMWEILGHGSLGLVILLDDTRPDPAGDLDYYVQAFRGLIDATGQVLVVGVTRLVPGAALDRYHQRLAALGLSAPVFEVDARRRDDVKCLLLALLSLLDDRVRRGATARAQ
ncbi:GTP-binding protein [Derxia gummosa]|uniref:GTP-binding protein n=1 Tax=Derxia gummosa DSM 723 TaxID=1121388 RepID=A0A8B6X1F1_9BURK|nr:ATP/GTP-binding protein [Derxia gummosa]